ncbi:hypothetical protein T05_4017 [Trichinella murrelli]|uniref:Uncharacterized protein n=1 Tax=Trichinella murrelli TaxID=144512 RepID=A0A0V0U1I8_9BILA|nr:hypothetical protein T05_4017 [Trichinella murrelli]
MSTCCVDIMGRFFGHCMIFLAATEILIQSSFSAGSTHSFRCLNPFGERWFKFFNLQRIPKRFLNHSHDPFPISTYPWSSFRDVSPFYAVCFCNA